MLSRLMVWFTFLILEPTYFFWLWPAFCSFLGLQTLSLVKIGKRCSTIPIMHTLWQSPMAMEHHPFDDFPLKPPFIYDFPAMEGTHPSLMLRLQQPQQPQQARPRQAQHHLQPLRTGVWHVQHTMEIYGD